MGKRSSFPRRKHDLYETTDPRAVAPLIPHLPRRARYAEPCAGSGQLIRLLEPHAECVWASDLVPQADPRIHETDGLSVGLGDADMFITNPPWTRALLHALIVHLSDLAPCWMLFDADWAHTKQAQKFMPRCRKIVSVGRVKWIAGSKTSGKDNAAWYLFGRPAAGAAPLFFTATTLPEATGRRARSCFDCGSAIGVSGKWALEQRAGVLTPVHRHCDNPDSYYAKGAEPIAPAPLLDWMAPLESATALSDREAA
jgi:hypothetical protein